MNIKDFTNAEILYHSDLKNKVLIQVPNTRYHILCSYIKSKDGWDMHLMDLLSSKRKKLADSVPLSIANYMVTKVVNDGLNLSLKYAVEFKMFSQHLIKQIKDKKNERKSRKWSVSRGSR